MSDRDSRKDEPSKAARGATLFSGNRDKKKKRTWSKAAANLKKTRTIYNQAEDPQHEKALITYLGKNGIEVKSYKDRYILRRLRVRMGRLKFKSYKDYLEYIKKHPTELGEIQESLSINVTRFFRNRDTYEMVRDTVLPQLAKKKTNLKIWSAGCAVGAEPYSIAMIATEAVPADVKVSVMATDVKEELLRTARYGVYSKPYLAEMKPSEISKFFSENSAGDFKVKPHIKRMVNFRQQDLMKDDFPRNVDMIFCRNVLIYVDRDAQNVILNSFFKALKPGGIVVLGRTETLFGDWRKSVDIVSTKHRIYQKKASGTFEPISMSDPVSDLVGSTFPGIKERTAKRREKLRNEQEQKKKTIKSTSKTFTTSERINELKDFRRTFEERKRIWEERMEKNKKKREERLSAIRKSTSAFQSNTRRSRNLTFQTSPAPSDEKSDSLSEYRKRLKNVKTRESKIRKDLDD